MAVYGSGADLLEWLPDEWADGLTTDDAATRMARASERIDTVITGAVDPQNTDQRDALRRAACIVAEARLVLGDAASVAGVGQSIGRVNVSAPPKTRGGLPQAALDELRSAALLRTRIEAW